MGHDMDDPLDESRRVIIGKFRSCVNELELLIANREECKAAAVYGEIIGMIIGNPIFNSGNSFADPRAWQVEVEQKATAAGLMNLASVVRTGPKLYFSEMGGESTSEIN